MNILTWLVIIPILTITGIMVVRDARQARTVSAIGMGIQLIVSFIIVFPTVCVINFLVNQ